MSLPAARTLFRQTLRTTPARSARATRRFESSTSKAADVVKESASKASATAKETAASAGDKAAEFKSKASEGLSRVSSSAGPAISNAASTAYSTINKIGGRTGQVIGFVEKQVPLVIYYARVGGELAKLVFKHQKMTPPPISTFQAYFQRAIKGIRNPQSLLPQSAEKAAQNPQSLMDSVRNVSTAQMVGGAVLLGEVLGFFTIGEMIGRMKLVGYRGETGSGEHH